jgi:3-dehydroquinate synthase
VIKLSVDAMLECIGPDLWEETLLRPMDFGHSFSRTLEADERFQLRHGEAVAVDCVMSSLISEQKGLLTAEDADAMLSLYARLGLPCTVAGISAETYKRARDEITVHRDGLLRAPLPAGIGGCAYADEISDAEIDAAFARLGAFASEHPAVAWDPSMGFN